MHCYKRRGKRRRINVGRYPFIDCQQAFNAYYAACTQVIGGVDVALQMAMQRERERAQPLVHPLTLSTLLHDHCYPRVLPPSGQNEMNGNCSPTKSSRCSAQGLLPMFSLPMWSG